MTLAKFRTLPKNRRHRRKTSTTKSYEARLKLMQISPGKPEDYGVRVLVENGKITRLGQYAGIKPNHLKTQQQFPNTQQIAEARREAGRREWSG